MWGNHTEWEEKRELEQTERTAHRRSATGGEREEEDLEERAVFASRAHGGGGG